MKPNDMAYAIVRALLNEGYVPGQGMLIQEIRSKLKVERYSDLEPGIAFACARDWIEVKNDTFIKLTTIGSVAPIP